VSFCFVIGCFDGVEKSRMKITQGFICLAGIMALWASGQARADTIFDDSGTDYSSSGALCVDGASFAPICSSSRAVILAPAALFVSSGNYDVTQIDVALSYTEGTNGATISLFTDVSEAPGALLGSWAVSGQPFNSPPITAISGISGIALATGSGYFLQISPADASTVDNWSLNAGGVTGEVYDPPFGGLNQTLPVFEILGTQTTSAPEPSSLMMSCSALLALVAVRHRHKG